MEITIWWIYRLRRIQLTSRGNPASVGLILVTATSLVINSFWILAAYASKVSTLISFSHSQRNHHQIAGHLGSRFKPKKLVDITPSCKKLDWEMTCQQCTRTLTNNPLMDRMRPTFLSKTKTLMEVLGSQMRLIWKRAYLTRGDLTNTARVWKPFQDWLKSQKPSMIHFQIKWLEIMKELTSVLLWVRFQGMVVMLGMQRVV